MKIEVEANRVVREKECKYHPTCESHVSLHPQAAPLSCVTSSSQDERNLPNSFFS